MVERKPAEQRPVLPPPPAAQQQQPNPFPKSGAARQPPRPRRNPAAPTQPPPLPPLPTVRRNGYDKVAVDSRLRQLANDHAELGQRRVRPRRG